jgi:hypothetical protein
MRSVLRNRLPMDIESRHRASRNAAVRVGGYLKVAAACLLASGATLAVGAPPLDKRLVRVLPVEGHFVTGSQLAPRQAIWILFMNEHCTLPIAGADKLWRGWSAAYQVGCWYPTGTTANGFVYIDAQGATHPIDMTPFAMPRAHILPDGTATITESDYDSRTFKARVNTERIRAALERLHRQPGP